MDFEKLLRVARKNELTKKEPVKYLQTKFKPPTKEQHERDKVLSEGVQRFLARKEEEEKKKQMEAERRKQELVALRSKDPKANKRIQTMLKRTKSANKSVMEDAVDVNNTADTLAGPSQPDEDDYGFVSETSSELYNKLIQKMYSTPSNDVPKFAPSKKPSGSNLSHTKERVKMALLKQEEEEKLPHKRKKKEKEKKEEDVVLEYGAPDRDLSKTVPEPSSGKAEKVKTKKAMPPPVDFQQLLKIAEQKQHEPIVFEPKIKKPQEPEILMTKKQKMEYERMQEWKRQRELRLSGKSSNPQEESKQNTVKAKTGSQSEGEPKVASAAPRKSVGAEDRLNSAKGNLKALPKSDKGSGSGKPKDQSDKSVKATNHRAQNQQFLGKKPARDDTDQLIRERDEALRTLREKERLIRERDEAVRMLKEKEQLIRERDEAVRKLKLLEKSEKDKSSAKNAEVPVSKGQKINGGDGSVAKVESRKNQDPKSVGAFRKSDSSRPGSKTESAATASATTSAKTLNGSRPPREAPKPVPRDAGAFGNLQRGKRFPPADVRRKATALKRRRIDSDDEYDSDLDGFIDDDDDNDVDSEEVSKVISEMFKYNKDKYSMYDDADDECMESNFAQISKEEFFSTKCGILEDLKDIQREKAKQARKKKR